ncbi:MAG TPA: DNA polymerase III subunit alpha [Caulobacteraceae bacterium]|nr:DNA polymerase III subunit alpha [Caulobacteraceae bacterium]
MGDSEHLDAPDETGGFVHLRVRSAFSLLEGAIRCETIAQLARAEAMPAVAIADRANLFGALEFSVACKGAGVQPIIGCALPVLGIGEGRKGRFALTPTLVLLAQNEEGWRNLCELSTAAYLGVDGHEAPHVSWRTLAERSTGLLLLSGGPDGPIDPLLAAGRHAEGEAALDEMREAFGDRLYIELQRHGLEEEAAAEHGLIGHAYARDIPLVATNDVCFADARMRRAHDVLLCIADGTFVGEDDRRRLTAEHWFKSADAMRALFADVPEACDHTLEIARRCAFMVRPRDPILPRFPTGAGRTEEDELAEQAREGLRRRLASAPPPDGDERPYWERLEREIAVIQKMGFAGYFLIVSDFMKWAAAHDIPVGPGRGSGAGSAVAWSLLITGIDPLKFGLLFERFLNPERVSMPDFDIDFCQERRDEVISYVQGKYGADRVAQIITFGSLQARAVVRDVGRVMQLPLGQVDRLAKMIPNNPANPVSLAQAIAGEPRLQAACRDDPAVADALAIAQQLEGLYRNASTHAAGVVIADRPLTELIPLYRDPRSPLPATQFNVKWVESAGVVKFDFLGLKTLTVLRRAVKLMELRGAGLDLAALPLDDPPAYELLSAGRTVGVFQMESAGMRDTLRKLRPSSLEEITALISLFRPGPMDSIDDYVDCKMERRPANILPGLESTLAETYGVIVYQEQVMQIAQILAGYTLGEADLLRRAMGKKKPKEMAEHHARFVGRAVERGLDQPTAEAMFERMAKFAGYGFNKCHAAPYALIAYQTAWLKANAPVEFFAASMSLDISNTDKLAVFYQDARDHGVAIRPPDVNASEADFSVEGGAVRYALGAIRNVGLAAMEQLVEVRRAGGRFADIFDFVERVDPRQVNKRALETLARAGAFDPIHPNRAQIVASAEQLIAYAQSLSADRAAAQESLFAAAADAVRPALPATPPWNPVQQLDEELAGVGFYLSGHPLQDMGAVLRRRGAQLLAEALPKVAAGADAFRMAGIVRRRQERTSVQDGSRFAFVALSDPTGAYEVRFQGDVLRRCREILEPGAAVIVKVRAKAADGDVRFFGDDAEPLQKTLEKHAGAVRLRLSPASVRLENLVSHLAGVEAGGGAVSVVAPLAGGREIEIRLPGRYNLDPAHRGALRAAPGVALLEDV